MVAEIHTLVEQLRAALGITGYPVPRDSERMLDLFPGVTVVEDRTPLPYLLVTSPRRARVVLPQHLRDRLREAALLEEIGHLLLDADAPGSGWSGLALVQDGRFERYAAVFTLAWRLPVKLLTSLSDEEILDASGCSREELAERRRTLLGL